MSSGEVLRLPFPFALGEAKMDLFAAELVFLIYIFDEGLQVGKGFIGHGCPLYLDYSDTGLIIAYVLA
jgi:hypothetical protein